MGYDRGLAERVADVLEQIGVRGARQKGMFGGRGFMKGKSTFVIVWGEGLIVKTAPGEYAGVLTEPGVTPFQPNGERPSTTWVIVSAEAIADDPQLSEWLQRAVRSVR